MRQKARSYVQPWMLSIDLSVFMMIMPVTMMLKMLTDEPLIHIMKPVCIKLLNGAMPISIARYKGSNGSNNSNVSVPAAFT